MCVTLERFVPATLAECYPEWRGESFDRFAPERIEETGPASVRIVGLATLLSDYAKGTVSATVARRVLRDYDPHEGNFPREFLPYKQEQAWEKMQPIFDVNPELKEAAEGYRAFAA